MLAQVVLAAEGISEWLENATIAINATEITANLTNGSFESTDIDFASIVRTEAAYATSVLTRRLQGMHDLAARLSSEEIPTTLNSSAFEPSSTFGTVPGIPVPANTSRAQRLPFTTPQKPSLLDLIGDDELRNISLDDSGMYSVVSVTGLTGDRVRFPSTRALGEKVDPRLAPGYTAVLAAAKVTLIVNFRSVEDFEPIKRILSLVVRSISPLSQVKVLVVDENGVKGVIDTEYHTPAQVLETGFKLFNDLLPSTMTSSMHIEQAIIDHIWPESGPQTTYLISSGLEAGMVMVTRRRSLLTDLVCISITAENTQDRLNLERYTHRRGGAVHNVPVRSYPTDIGLRTALSPPLDHSAGGLRSYAIMPPRMTPNNALGPMSSALATDGCFTLSVPVERDGSLHGVITSFVCDCHVLAEGIVPGNQFNYLALGYRLGDRVLALSHPEIENIRFTAGFDAVLTEDIGTIERNSSITAQIVVTPSGVASEDALLVRPTVESVSEYERTNYVVKVPGSYHWTHAAFPELVVVLFLTDRSIYTRATPLSEIPEPLPIWSVAFANLGDFPEIINPFVMSSDGRVGSNESVALYSSYLGFNLTEDQFSAVSATSGFARQVSDYLSSYPDISSFNFTIDDRLLTLSYLTSQLTDHWRAMMASDRPPTFIGLTQSSIDAVSYLPGLDIGNTYSVHARSWHSRALALADTLVSSPTTMRSRDVNDLCTGVVAPLYMEDGDSWGTSYVFYSYAVFYDAIHQVIDEYVPTGHAMLIDSMGFLLLHDDFLDIPAAYIAAKYSVQSLLTERHPMIASALVSEGLFRYTDFITPLTLESCLTVEVDRSAMIHNSGWTMKLSYESDVIIHFSVAGPDQFLIVVEGDMSTTVAFPSPHECHCDHDAAIRSEVMDFESFKGKFANHSLFDHEYTRPSYFDTSVATVVAVGSVFVLTVFLVLSCTRMRG
ncbi:hypothetical protein J8273_3750 [Carpediemonas membranifera]|uniref:Uncharacterized protein n=1 Tax=Carpediemonas membranifera TaxID=201153 RepID=A0A8J6B5M4_9EUKA|nr:hypothetical protein J8273_3750 [Carpediemonas membranifera]|eukprot:KAG9394774.1 hypothetical protein J8273_3750 [Carpediemonas membranifera]